MRPPSQRYVILSVTYLRDSTCADHSSDILPYRHARSPQILGGVRVLLHNRDQLSGMLSDKGPISNDRLASLSTLS